MAVKKRCPFCNKRLRPDGTCQTKTCPLYVPEPTPEPTEPTDGDTTPATETPSDTNVGDNTVTEPKP